MAVAADVFGSSLIGAYLHGSAVLGGLRPTSDVDILAVIDRHSTEAEWRRLIASLMPISGSPEPRGQFRPVELTVITQAEVRPWRYPPRMEFQYGEWLKRHYEAGFVPEPSLNPDLAPLVTMALAGNHPLVGPPPAELLDEVPAEDLRRAIVAGIPELLADLQSDTRNVLLTLVRIWVTLATGEIRSKEDAAAWAAERLDGEARDVVRATRDQYLAGTHGDWIGLLTEARVAAADLQAKIDAIV